MKQLIVFPGNNVENRTWGEMMGETYAPYVDTVDVLSYDHWVTGDPMIDFALELDKLTARYSILPLGGEIYIIAKSSGALLALQALEARILQPKHSFFFGVPFDLAEQFSVFGCSMSPLMTVTSPIAAFHNVKDPVADFRFTEAVFTQYLPHVSIVKTSEENHWYGDTDVYDAYIVPVLKGEV